MLLFKPEIVQMFRGVPEIWNGAQGLAQSDRFAVWRRGSWRDHWEDCGGRSEKSLDEWEDDDVETFIEDLGDNTMEIGGGSAEAVLWNHDRRPVRTVWKSGEPIDAKTLKEMFPRACPPWRISPRRA